MARRRQETLWIHRWSRQLIAGIAALGVLETAYLSWAKLTGSPIACPVEGCDRVLDSPYATMLGMPLPLFGLLAYATMFALAAIPFTASAETQSERRQTLERSTWPLIFILALAMVICSGYLMYLMVFVLKALCPYCITSALFTLSFFLLAVLGRRWEDQGQLLMTGVITGMVALTAVMALYAPIQATANANAAGIGQAGPPVTSPSSAADVALAKHLKSIGAKMYGAWWCPHCYDQKALFGAEAVAELPYVECASDGKNPQTALCRSKSEVTGFPTWEIDGKFYAGTQTLEQLAELSGYTGPKNFKS